MTTTITVDTGNNPPVSFSSTVTASTWLSINPLSGMTPTTVTVTVDRSGLRPGSYGSVMLSSQGNGSREPRGGRCAEPQPVAAVPGVQLFA